MRLEVEPGVFICVGDGQRRLVDVHTDSVRAAVHVAPEYLIGAVRRSGGWAYVGRSGASYWTHDPLGDFVAVYAPPKPLENVVAQGSTILATNRDGSLLRSGDGGAAWQVVAEARAPTRRFIDLDFSQSGAGIALAVPEALYQTTDAGGSWSPVATDAVGTLMVAARPSGPEIWTSFSGGYVSLPSGLGPASDGIGRRSSREEQRTDVRGPSAAALVDGRAGFFSNGEYFELDASYPTAALRGALERPLKRLQLETIRGCLVPKLAIFGRFATIACGQQRRPGTYLVDFYRSEDNGLSFQKEDFQLRVRTKPADLSATFQRSDDSLDLMLAAGADGALVISGACDSLSCKRPRVVYRSSSGQLLDSATPALRGALRGLVFARDGRRAIALGAERSGRRYLVLTSEDAGRTFTARQRYEARAPDTSEGVFQAVWAAEGSGGQVAFSVREWGKPRILIVSDDQASPSWLDSPAPEALVAAAGLRAFAVLPDLSRAWQSVDGRSWQSVPMPPRICPYTDGCPRAVACYPWGCVVSTELTRYGWGASPDFLPLDRPQPPKRDPADLQGPELRCTVDRSSAQLLEGLEELPSLTDFVVGPDDWQVVTVDLRTATARLVRARHSARAERVTLLAPVHPASSYAIAAAVTLTGAAAARYSLPVTGAGHDGDGVSRILHAGWLGVGDEHVLHARLTDVNILPFSGASRTPSVARRGMFRLLQATKHGLFLKPASRLGGSPAYLVSETASTRVPLPSDHGLATKFGFPRFLAQSGTDICTFYLARGTVLRACPEGSDFELKLHQVGLHSRSALFEEILGLTTVSGHPYVHVHRHDDQGYARGELYPLALEGTVVEQPVSAPVPVDLDAGRPCTTEERLQTARVAVPVAPSSFRSVWIEGANMVPNATTTRSVVLFGSAEDPCLAALETEPPAESQEPERRVAHPLPPIRARALVLVDDPKHSWLFEQVNRRPSQSEGVQRGGAPEYEAGPVTVAPMSCEPTPR